VATTAQPPNHYEFLQISPNAEPDTIHRVFRFLAARFHPDNPETGDPEKFVLLKEAYDVLSDPRRRAKYDAALTTDVAEPDPLSTSIDFMDNLEGELNRRLAVLALLYLRRRENPDRPQVSLFEVETRMGFPRDYLEFTLWYIHKKGYITRADNAEFTLTVEGVDFVETQRAQLPILHKLLTSGASATDYTGPNRRRPDSSSTPPYTGPERRVRLNRRKQALTDS
jgi:curved DNA-binding protein CbpA